MVKVWTGDECGIIKEYDDTKKKVRLINDDLSEMNRSNGVVDLVRLGDDDKSMVAAQLIDGRIDLYSADRGSREKRLKSVWEDGKALALYGLKTNGTLCSISTKGSVVLRNADDEIHHDFNVFGELKQQQENDSIAAAHAVSVVNNWVALGGKDRDMVVWDLQTQQQVWKAKNLPPHPQTLLQPRVYPSAAVCDTNTLAVGTAHHQVRLYDVRQQRRPTAHTTMDQRPYRLTALCWSSCHHHHLFVGDAAGYAYVLDVRKLSAEVGRFVGPRGSLRGMVTTTTTSTQTPMVYMVGLDRHLRMYNEQTRKTVQAVYLKQRLNCVTVVDSSSSSSNDDDLTPTGTGDAQQEDQVEDYIDSSTDGSDDDDTDADSNDESEDDEPNDRRKRQRSS